MIIKVCGITESSNLSAILSLEPQMLGFNFYPSSKRYVEGRLDPSELLKIPESCHRVGIFVNESENTIISLSKKYHLNMAQLHGNEPVEVCKQLKNKGIKLIKVFSVGDDFDFTALTDYVSYCEYFLFDTKTKGFGGSGRKFDWSILSGYTLAKPFLLSGGIEPGDEQAIAELKHPAFAGVDLNSRFEISPGIKDIEKLKNFINNLGRIQ